MKQFEIALFSALVVLCGADTVPVQGAPRPGDVEFSKAQAQRIIAAYEARDTTATGRIVRETDAWADTLPAAVQSWLPAYQASIYYNAACTYALAGAREQALRYLERSIGAGFDDREHILGDPDLAALRRDRRYRKLVGSIRTRSERYLVVLGKAARFDERDRRSCPAFSYQSADEEHLKLLRRAFDLDSVAGKGSDVSKVIRLMRWVHNQARHDGNVDNPEPRNALAMIGACRDSSRTMNCRGLAITLNEVYLSLGFVSRYVTCLPQDTTDTDCHVIDAVFVPSMNKWVWMDPTFEAYVTDEKGTLLGPGEVRERLIANKPLLLNPDANWNGETSQTVEGYLRTYMAKNLYRLECPVESEYNYETDGQTARFVCLAPVEFNSQIPKVMERNERPGSGRRRVTYTNNAVTFWQAPLSPAGVPASGH